MLSLSDIAAFLWIHHRQTWRAIFYLASGLGTACLILGLLSIDADLPSTETDRRIDWLGALLATTGLVFIVFVLSDGEIVGWGTSCDPFTEFAPPSC